ncbi:MAG: hypothetical protein NTV43_06375 [Methylococcales bacterium]|nr:hypothetical protein [Methylococcales bacterium]
MQKFQHSALLEAGYDLHLLPKPTLQRRLSYFAPEVTSTCFTVLQLSSTLSQWIKASVSFARRFHTRKPPSTALAQPVPETKSPLNVLRHPQKQHPRSAH